MSRSPIQSWEAVSKLLALHPDLNVALHLCLREARAFPDHGVELNLVPDRREIKGGQKTPSLLDVLPIASFARHRVGALATLESEHASSPRERTAKRRVAFKVSSNNVARNALVYLLGDDCERRNA
jgi:hypothetical protein